MDSMETDLRQLMYMVAAAQAAAEKRRSGSTPSRGAQNVNAAARR